MKRAALDRWLKGLSPSGRALWGGALRGALPLSLVCASVLSLRVKQRAPTALLMIYAVVGLGLVGAVVLITAIELRWGKEKPARVVVLSCLAGHATWLFAVAQTGYLPPALAGDQSGAWGAALAAFARLDSYSWISLVFLGQLPAASYLASRGQLLGALALSGPVALCVPLWMCVEAAGAHCERRLAIWAERHWE